MTDKRLMVIDDEPEFGEFVRRVAEEKGYDVEVKVLPEDFMQAYKSFDPTLIVLDIVMPNIDGIELVKWLYDQQCRASVILVTGADPMYMDAAKKIAENNNVTVTASLTKPIEVTDLRAVLE
jgi:DNA-binding response OmpR family regulator